MTCPIKQEKCYSSCTFWKGKCSYTARMAEIRNQANKIEASFTVNAYRSIAR